MRACSTIWVRGQFWRYCGRAIQHHPLPCFDVQFMVDVPALIASVHGAALGAVDQETAIHFQGLARNRPNMCDFGRVGLKFGPKSARFCPSCLDTAKFSAECANVGPRLAKSKFGQRRPGISQNWFEFE